MSAPWYAPYRDLLEQLGPHALAGRWQDCVEGLNARACARGLRNGQGRPLRFGAPGAAGSAAYEAHIWATGEVPTRTDASGGWHDFFNALAALVAAVFAPLWQIFLYGPSITSLAVIVMSGLLVWRHRANIAKLMAGKESRIGGR